MKCLVTGATGFIGSALCPALAERGVNVLALSRGINVPACADALVLDLAATALPAAQLEGVDVVVHLAGVAHQNADPQAYEQLNRDATLALAQAAQAAGVGHFIFVSSVKAMGAAADARPRAEQDTVPPADPYGLSKWQAEEGLRALAVEGGMAISILRPALVYGPRPKGNLALLERGIRCGLPRPPEEGGRSMISLPDLVELLCRLAEREAGGTQTWIVSDGQSYSSRTIYDVLRARHGAAPGRNWCPRWLWMTAARLLGVQEKFFGTEHYDNRALLAAVDWRPQHSLADVLGGSA